MHAWSGCDTTSATFGQGKTALLKKIMTSNNLQQISYLMSNADASSEQIGKLVSKYSFACMVASIQIP